MKTTIGYVSKENPFIDRKAWSGTIFKIREGIENAGFKVIWIPYKVNQLKLTILKILIKIFCGKKALTTQNKFYYKLCAQSIEVDKIKECDYLFFPGGAQIGVFLNTKKPIIYYTDASFKQMINYYWHNQSEWVLKQGDSMEKKAIKNSYINIRSSKWAADSVITDYEGNPKRNYIIEFGANIDDKDIIHCKTYKNNETLNILFSGVDWERKGGDIAVKSVQLLNQRGIKTNLFITGISCLPTQYQNLPYIKNLGFLNKNIPEQYQQYINVISNSHIFLLPTKAECSAIVFCEASAFGLPIFTYNTGGLANYILDGVNGYKLPLKATATDFTNIIIECIKNNELEKLHYGGINLYHNVFNWKVWANKFKEIITISE